MLPVKSSSVIVILAALVCGLCPRTGSHFIPSLSVEPSVKPSCSKLNCAFTRGRRTFPLSEALLLPGSFHQRPTRFNRRIRGAGHRNHLTAVKSHHRRDSVLLSCRL